MTTNDTTAVRGWIETWARFGHVARGIVYILVGLLALQAARGGEEPTGAEGAVAEAGEFSGVLLWLIVVGIAGYATWRFAEAFTDPERLGSDASGLRKRAARFG
ncbi:MAG TPA: DUF1206 domain-containing protein, partial [Thermoanaerobaculia bacterium]|nr:DUF1206 domain-containing protein [Thermoanaerobaculia bacterium]